MKVAFFTAGRGSGGVYRAYALYKALKRLKPGMQFIPIVYTEYPWLVKAWGMPAVMPIGTNVLNSPKTDMLNFLTTAIARYQPDLLISNYHIAIPENLTTAYPDLRLWLLLREFRDMGKWLEPLTPSKWEKIISIEPGATMQITNARIPGTFNLLEEVPPILATWPEEIYSEEVARTMLTGVPYPAKRIAIVAHNGLTFQEMLDRWGQIDAISQGYDVKVFTQDTRFRNEPGVFFRETPIARFLTGADLFVAAAGYNAFWEWTKYGNRRAHVHWIAIPRLYEEPIERTRQKLDISQYRKLPNGADVLANWIN